MRRTAPILFSHNSLCSVCSVCSKL